MHNARTFWMKELTENLRTKRLLVLMCVFIFFAITGPLMVRYMSEFLALFIPGDDETGQALLEAMGTPTWQDSLIAYYGNLGQIGALTVLLLYMGTILREKRSGTADLVMTKGLSPLVFVLAKFDVAAVMILVTNFIALSVSYAYTLLLFEDVGSFVHVLWGGAAFSVFLLMILAITIFTSALAKSTAMAAVLGFLAFMILGIISAVPRIGVYSPGSLMMQAPIVLTFGEVPDRFVAGIVIAVLISALCLWGAVRLTAIKHVPNA